MYRLVRPLLFMLDPGLAHRTAIAALAPLEYLAPLRLAARGLVVPQDPRLEVRKMGLVFPNPIGVAAGFDKNGQRPRALAALGFGHIELGTVTAEKQGPNPPPNMFRLPLDRAIVNRLGFPNEGARQVGERLSKRKPGIPMGISIGKSRSVPLERALEDYVASLRAVREAADFIVVNVSSPNTKDLRALQAADLARELFAVSMKEAAGVPLLVKIAPDLPDEAVDAICLEADSAGLSGVVATNTTIARTGLATKAAEIDRIGAGGLSGPPLFPRALAVVRRARARLGPEACVIGVGGIRNVETALAMLRAGADLLQIYTSFVYGGPLMARHLALGLAARLDEEGASSLDDLVRTRAATSRSSSAAN